MKKLKLRALQLGAAEVLTRAQLKNVLGGDDGGGTCTLTYTTDSDPTPKTISYTVSGSCSQQSSSMNAMCVDNITLDLFKTCRYDCGCDGWGS
jgi:hypothetical protein